jgi:hypothetical protein
MHGLLQAGALAIFRQGGNMEILEKVLIVLLVIGLVCTLFGVIILALAPGTYNLPIAATGNPIGSKTGLAEDHMYFFIFGDASDANIVQACKNGGITKVSTVDYKMENFMFIKQTFTCVVNGE